MNMCRALWTRLGCCTAGRTLVCTSLHAKTEVSPVQKVIQLLDDLKGKVRGELSRRRSHLKESLQLRLLNQSLDSRASCTGSSAASSFQYPNLRIWPTSFSLLPSSVPALLLTSFTPSLFFFPASCSSPFYPSISHQLLPSIPPFIFPTTSRAHSFLPSPWSFFKS